METLTDSTRGGSSSFVKAMGAIYVSRMPSEGIFTSYEKDILYRLLC